MTASNNSVKIFISYSWQPASNRERVIQLAERLSLDGLHVILDRWDLKEGQDKNQFMEQMVNDPGVRKVLLICTKDYQEKANKRKGGVGTESLIISNEIYSKAAQTKFIPIVFETDEDGKAFVPTFVNSRIYIDLSNSSIFEENYEMLLRNLYDRPSHKRPPIGTPPAYILEENLPILPTAHKVSAIKNAFENEKQNAILFVQAYYDSFLQGLKSFEIDENELTSETYDDIVLSKIESLTIMRDDFLHFLETYLSASLIIDTGRLHSFLEKMLEYLLKLKGFTSSQDSFASVQVDHFRYFYYEFFLFFTAKMIAKERFKELAYIIQTPFVLSTYNNDDFTEYRFTYFRNYVATLDEFRNKKMKLNRISITADLIKSRTKAPLNFTELQQADAILYYLSLIHNPRNYFSRPFWYPVTTVYDLYRLPIMSKAKSKKYFDKIKILFGVETKEELAKRIDEIISAGQDKVDRFNINIPYISSGLNIENIATIS